MALKINQRDISKINYLFEKSFKEMELKMRDVSINNIKVKENLKEIKRLENKKYSLDEIISDKKSELSILKQLLILKENKKLDFQDIVSKYLNQLISIDDKMNKKIDKLEQKNYIVEKKKKIINSLVECFNNEFNNCLNNNNNINDKNDMNKKFKKYKSLLFEEKLTKINNDCYENENLNLDNNNIINNKKKDNDNDNGKNEDFIKEEKKDIYNDFQGSINKTTINDINNRKNNNNEKKRGSKKNNRINEANIKAKNMNNLDEQKKNSILNEINFVPNKNLLNPRNNLKNIIMQNEKDKYNRKKKENYIKFIKIILAITKKIVIRLNKKTFNLLIVFNNSLKLKIILDKYNKIIIPKIIKLLKNSSKIYNAEKENIIDENEFLKEIRNNNDENNKNKYAIENFEKNLNKIKEVNEEIKEIEKKMNDFIYKIMESNKL